MDCAPVPVYPTVPPDNVVVPETVGKEDSVFSVPFVIEKFPETVKELPERIVMTIDELPMVKSAVAAAVLILMIVPVPIVTASMLEGTPVGVQLAAVFQLLSVPPVQTFPLSPIWKSPNAVMPDACVVVAVRVPIVWTVQVPEVNFETLKLPVVVPASRSPATNVNVAL